MKRERTNISKKILVLTFFSILLISLVIGAISAADPVSKEEVTQTTKTITQNIAAVVSGIFQGIGDVLSPLYGDKAWFTQILFGILLWMILYSITETMFGSKYLTSIISLVIVFLVFIALPQDFLQSILISYGAMGAAILSVIPFMIILVFTVRVQSALVARILWIFFITYYAGILVYSWVTSGDFISSTSIVYLFALIAGILIFSFIGTIRKAIFKGEMSALKEQGNKVANRSKILHQIQKEELDEGYGKAGKK